jgi:ferric-dicitrate binding protein FerR (iron transport regulator)
LNSEDWIAFLDGESSPQVEDKIERDLARDPIAMTRFRALCRQRLMLAETLKATAAPPQGAPFRLRWQVAAAMLFFAVSVTAVWMRGAGNAVSRVVQGRVLVAGTPVESLPAGALAEIPGDSTAEIALPDGSTVALLASSRALLHGVPGCSREIVELRRGTARIRAPKGDGEVRIKPALGTMTVRGAGFSVELVPEPNRGGRSMESLLALVVSALVGNVQVEVAGKILVIPAGEVRVIGADGAVANSLPEFVAFQEKDKEKDGDKGEKEDKEKKGKKKGDKKDKKEKDDDDKEEKGGKDKEKGNKDN